MSSIGIPSYSASELESIGQEFIRLHNDPAVVPVDIDLLIERAGYDIRPIQGLQRDHGVMGVPVYYQEITAICIDRELMDRKPLITRFTEAEELAHILLHSSVFEDCRSLEEAIERYMELEGNDIWVMDRNARYLAGVILIPKDPLRQDLGRVSQQMNFSGFPSLPDLLRQIYVGLAKKYEVSPSAIQFRVSNATFFDLKQRFTEDFQRSRRL